MITLTNVCIQDLYGTRMYISICLSPIGPGALSCNESSCGPSTAAATGPSGDKRASTSAEHIFLLLPFPINLYNYSGYVLYGVKFLNYKTYFFHISLNRHFEAQCVNAQRTILSGVWSPSPARNGIVTHCQYFCNSTGFDRRCYRYCIIVSC